MFKKIWNILKQTYSINTDNTQRTRNVEIIDSGSNIIKLVFPKGILGEDLLLREENNVNKLEYDRDKIYYIDLINVLYADSIGIGYLTKQVQNIKSANSKYVIINMNSEIREALNLLGFLDYLNIV